MAKAKTLKKPKGLTKSQEDKKPEIPAFDLSKIMILDKESSAEVGASFSDYKTMSQDLRYQGYELACSLAREIAKDSIGYDHSSELLDSAPDSEFKRFAKITVRKNQSKSRYDEDSDEEEASDEDEIGYRHDHYEEVKDNFKEKLNEAIGEGSFSRFDSFKELLVMATKEGFTGNAGDFETLLKRSEEFRELCQNETTNYTG